MASRRFWITKDDIIREAISRFTTGTSALITSRHLLEIYDKIQPDNEISEKQAEAAILQVVGTNICDRDEIFDVLLELDRRNFLVKDLKWEFMFLDTERNGSISEEKAYILFRGIHGDSCTLEWEEFLSRREAPGSFICFDELEVILCDIL